MVEIQRNVPKEAAKASSPGCNCAAQDHPSGEDRIPRGAGRPHWRNLLRRSIETAGQLARIFPVDKREISRVIARYPMRINPYYLSLIRRPLDPIWMQCVPSLHELEDADGMVDPLDEAGHSPVPNLIHRYPDRAVLLASCQCAIYCRFCNRKRMVGHGFPVTPSIIGRAVQYIRDHREIDDVILSGGDPLLLPDRMLDGILRELREIPHVEVIRIGTRVPCTLPHRITTRLCRLLKRHHPLYINTHFNHPRELTPQSRLACKRLVDSGIPVGCQTVLLRGVNDDPSVMRRLMKGLVAMRVRPYYLFQADLVKGTSHFRTPVQHGLELMRSLWGFTSGLCIPHYAVDLPKGGGKSPLSPSYVVGEEGPDLLIRNFQGKPYRYPRQGTE